MGEPHNREIRPHYRLDAWKQAMQLVREVYSLIQAFPKEEVFGLTSQVRCAAVSVPSNLAEGAARMGDKEFAHFVARGSLSELETQLLIAADLGYMQKDNKVFATVDRVSRLVTGLHKAARR